MIVIENLLKNQDHSYFQSLCYDVPYFISSSTEDKTHGILHSYLSAEDQYKSIFNTIIEKTSLKGDISTVLQAYINCAPAGKFHGGDWHNDPGATTILYYPFGWDQKYGGRTVFKNGKSVDYIANSAVCFPAQLVHKAEPHRAPNWRFTIALKTTLDMNNEDSNIK